MGTVTPSESALIFLNRDCKRAVRSLVQNPWAMATITVLVLNIASAAGQTAPAKQLMSEQAFKNVTVLKGIPVDEFMDTMGFISASTNYNCTDCHVEPKAEGDWSVYAEETPRKATARRMILMVQSINKTNFGGARVVTCYTCHRNVQGAPKITPSLADQYGEPPTPDPNEVEIRRQVPGAPSADQIFDTYLQAVGGAQKTAAITSIVFKGTYQGYAEPKAPVDIYVKSPNQRTMVVHTDGGDRTTTFDGTNGWVAAPAADKPFPVIRVYQRGPGRRPARRTAFLSGGNQASHNETADRFEQH